MTSIRLRIFSLIMLFSGPLAAQAQLTVDPGAGPQRVFAGDRRNIAVVFHNASERAFEGTITTRLYQTASATAARLSDTPWKKLQILPGQTVLESAQLSFPEVKAETGFLVQWLENTQRVIGETEVLVYPHDLLKDLKLLLGDQPLGVFDPENQLKPLLESTAAEFVDLEDTGLENFHEKLAIIRPLDSKSQMQEGLAKQIGALAKKGVAVVWILEQPERCDVLTPSFYTVHEETGAVVVVQADLLAGLPESPQSQLNLIQFARLALHPKPSHLPHYHDL
jgi:hypothetical protein